VARPLNEVEQATWRVVLSASVLLVERLDRELQEAHGLSLPEYQVLAHLASVPGRGLRMRELADRALVSKSRLTHVVNRLEASGLAVREPCAGDRRGLNAVLTRRGQRMVQLAAATHVHGVRRHLIEALPRRDVVAVTRGLSHVVDHLLTDRTRC
jgi:DNA-binding MarR family transcriptional regulator